MIPKKYINFVRNGIKEQIRINEEIIQDYYQKLEILKNGSLTQKSLLISDLYERKVGKSNVLKTKSSDMFLFDCKEYQNGCLKIIDELKHEIEILNTISQAITKEGIQAVTYELPALILLIGGNPYRYFQYLILLAIKYNGDHDKNGNLYSELDKQLHYYEKEMAKLINNDFRIDFFENSKFVNLFGEYLDVYVNERKDNLYSLIDPAVSERAFVIKLTMHDYLLVHNIFLNILDEKEEVAESLKEETKIVVEDPLQDYVQNGKVIKFCDSETFKKLLAKSNLSIEKQNEYLRQMNNFFNKMHAEKLMQRKNSILVEILDENELALYNMAKVSNKVEATQIIKDIDAILELFLDVKSEEDKEELTCECKLYISYLNDVLEVKEEKETYMPNVLYYKVDGEPFILDNIKGDRTVQKSSYKQILASINKIIDGNTVGDREVQGTSLPIHLWAKGNEFKVFYTIIKDVTIIIAGFRKDIAFDKIKSIVNSKSFMSYLAEIKVFSENNAIPDEREYTNLITAELSASGRVRKK